MNRGKNRIPKVAVVLVAIVMGVSYVAAGSYAQQNNQPAQRSLPQRPQGADQTVESLNTIYSHRLPALQSMLARAIRHLEAGHQQEALKELRQLETSLETTRQTLGKHVEPPIVNA